MDVEALKLAAAAFKRALQQDDRQSLISAASKLIELRAPLGNQWQGLAQKVFQWGELTLAIKALDTWSNQGGGHFAAYDKANLLARVGRVREAADLAAALPPEAPLPVANAYLQGFLATHLGQREQALRQFRRAVRLAPQSGRSWLEIVRLGDANAGDVATMREALKRDGALPVEDRAAFEIAFGILEHRRGNPSAAFLHYKRATQIQRERYKYDPIDNESSAAVAASWTAGIIRELAEHPPAATRRPIFVTGLPRSGTTLVEQILAVHSMVDGGGELGLTRQLEAIVGGFSPDDVRSHLASNGSVSALRETYLRLVGERFAGQSLFIDKTLNQSRSLGPLSMMFPNAPIIWLHRDPLDNALSIYRTWLANNTVGSWLLEDIAHHMKLEDGLREHFARELGDRLLVVPYEDLISDPSGWIERITTHCGLDPEPRQIEFHKADRGVTTASSMQVRKPINREGIGSARPYREIMQPFVDAYGL